MSIQELVVTVGVVTGLTLPMTALPVAAQTARGAHGVMPCDAACTLRQDMRKLWTNHVVWTRDYVVAAVADQPDAQAAATRLLKNQDDIGAAVSTYYGGGSRTRSRSPAS